MYNPNYINNSVYPQYGQLPTQTPNFNNNQFIIRQVTGLEEGKNLPIDPINTYILTDFTNKNIYVKKINNNGLIDFYTFKQLDDQQQYNNSYINNNQDLNIINQRLTNIETMLLGGFKQLESNVLQPNESIISQPNESIISQPNESTNKPNRSSK